MPFPTLCVINGDAIAGGLVITQVFDFRIMKEKPATMALADVNIGMTMPSDLYHMLKDRLVPNSLRKIFYG